MMNQERQRPRCTPEVEIYQRCIERRAAVRQAKVEASIMPSGKTMIMAALAALAVAVLGYLTYRILKKGK